MNGILRNKHMPGFPQTSSEALGAETETMPQPSSKGMANSRHVIYSLAISIKELPVKGWTQYTIHTLGFDGESSEPSQRHKSSLLSSVGNL